MARQMKDSGIEWIGKIPENWKVQRAKTLFSQRLTKGNQDITLLAATQKYGMLPQSEVEGVVQVKENADLQQFRTVHKDDYVISLRSFQGGFEFSQYEGVCSPAYQVFYNIKPVYHPYYRLMFKSDGFIKKMNSLTVGIRDGKNIQYDDFANSLIPVPPLDEQEHIASYLDHKCSQIDAIIAKQQQIIEKLKEYKLSIITEAVTKGLDPNVPMKDSGVEWIGKIPKHWNVAKMKFVASFFNGDRSSKYPSGTDIVDTGVIFVTSNNLGNIILNKNVDTKYITKEKYDDLGGAKLRINDIIFCLRGSVGKCSINKTESEGTIASSLVAIRAKKIPADYLIFVLQCPGITAMSMLNAIGIGSLNLSAEDISEIFIPVPSQDDAKQIAEFLERKIKAIDKMINKKADCISKLIDYKKSLIYEVVTGKTTIG